MEFHRFVAIGDSFTEGYGDPVGLIEQFDRAGAV